MHLKPIQRQMQQLPAQVRYLILSSFQWLPFLRAGHSGWEMWAGKGWQFTGRGDLSAGEVGEAGSRQRDWECHGSARGHTAYTGLAAEPSSVGSAKGMSWPRSASFMVRKPLTCAPIACQLLPSQCPVLWRAHRQRHLMILANSPSSRRKHQGVTLGLVASCSREKWAFNGISSKREKLISSPLSCYSRPSFKLAKQASIQYVLHFYLGLPLPSSAADLTPLPDNVKQLLLIYLNTLCQPRRPGMPKVTVEG